MTGLVQCSDGFYYRNYRNGSVFCTAKIFIARVVQCSDKCFLGMVQCCDDFYFWKSSVQ